MFQSSTSGFKHNFALLWYYIILLACNATTLATRFTLCLLGRRRWKPGLRGWSWAWEGLGQFSFFLSHCPTVFNWQGVDVPQVWLAHDLSHLYHKLYPPNALICPVEEREQQLMCSSQQAEVHPTALRALSCFISCQHRGWTRKNRQCLNT